MRGSVALVSGTARPDEIRKPRGARAAEPRDAIASPVAFPWSLLRQKAIGESMDLQGATVKSGCEIFCLGGDQLCGTRSRGHGRVLDLSP